MGLSITVLLTLASMHGSLNAITPPIAYNTRLDVWVIGCFLVVTAALLETVAVVAFRHYHRMSHRKEGTKVCTYT